MEDIIVFIYAQCIQYQQVSQLKIGRASKKKKSMMKMIAQQTTAAQDGRENIVWIVGENLHRFLSIIFILLFSIFIFVISAAFKL